MNQSSYDDPFRPRTTRNNKGGYYGNQNPFGSFFGNGFFWKISLILMISIFSYYLYFFKLLFVLIYKLR